MFCIWFLKKIPGLQTTSKFVEDMAEQIKHFSHEKHALLLRQVDKKIICYGCQEQVLEATAYCCFSCDFFLHKRCAELPLEITHPMHPEHPLLLLKEAPYKGIIVCNACKRSDWKFFTYHCKSCEFDLDVFCANMVDRKLEHESHEHPMVLQRRPATFHCNACDKKDEDSSYMCPTCPFWIHQRCASLPRSVKTKNHDHSLSLAYSLPAKYRSFEHCCPICRFRVHLSTWVYCCGPCRRFFHLTCIMISQEDTERQPKEDINDSISEGELDLEDRDKCSIRRKEEEDQCAFKQNLVRLPSTHATQELITHSLLKRYQSSSDSSSETEIKEKVVVKGHKHPLILSKKVQTQHEIKSTEEEEAILVCDWCIEPISSSDLHYTCKESQCSYFLHETCYNLPSELQIAQHPEHPLLLVHAPRNVGFLWCVACTRWSNGVFYHCKPCDLVICMKCASASMIPRVAHDAHEHPLTQFESSNRIVCSACGFERGNFGFACEGCHFYLDYWCALLPPMNKQRWDKHPLILMYSSYIEHPEEFYCVLCELEMDPNEWMYHCRDCDYSLHPWCILQIELFRRVKFGRSLHINNHSHPLTHISEAKYESFCKGCNKSLDWEEAFKCDACTFYLCPGCADEKELPQL